MSGSHDFPFPLRSVIVFLHRSCNVGCEHCSARADANQRSGWHASQMESLFKTLSGIQPPPYVVWTGGEPFLTPDLLRTAVRTAGSSGFHSEILTSGGILPSESILDALGAIPGTRLRISVDSLHARHIPITNIADLASAAEKSGMKVCFTLRDIPGRTPAAHLISQIRNRIPGLFSRQQDSRFIHTIPHVPIQETPASGLTVDAKLQAPELHCKNGFQDLVVGEDGAVYPCCGAVSFEDRDLLRLGMISGQSGNGRPFRPMISPLSDLLRNRGPSGLARVLGIHPHSICAPPIEHPCRLCYSLFGFHGKEIRDHFTHPA